MCFLTSFVVIDTPFDYLLKVERAGKSDIRSFFTYCNAIVSSLALVAIMVMKIMLSMSGQDSSAFDVETQTANGIDGSDTFSVMVSRGGEPALSLVNLAFYYSNRNV